MKIAKFVQEVSVIDPESNLEVEIAIYKHSNGGLFGIDSSFIEQELGADFDCDNYAIIPDPMINAFGSNSEDVIMLCE